MKKKQLYLLCPFITLILEILPYGAVLNFANPEGNSWHRTYSYFSLTPFGYANFAPFITAIITCAIITLLVVILFVNKPCILRITKVLVCIGIALSLCPLFYGIDNYSIVGLLITISLIAELVLLFITMSKSSEF